MLNKVVDNQADKEQEVLIQESICVEPGGRNCLVTCN